jgi:HAD superfamily hydrolase (TIGR01509 family)
VIKALIFDFDGLILETEFCDYEAWRQTLGARGADFPQSLYARAIGSSFADQGVDPYAILEEHLGQPIDRDAILAEHHVLMYRLVDAQPVQPGVETIIEQGKRMGLKLAVASSSPRRWIDQHLGRLGLLGQFDVIKTAEDVERIKPNPDLFLAALDALQIGSHEAIVFEDSPNGVTAAKRAGIFAVAVPTEMTASLDLSHADLRVGSLAAMSLEEMIARANNLR